MDTNGQAVVVESVPSSVPPAERLNVHGLVREAFKNSDRPEELTVKRVMVIVRARFAQHGLDPNEVSLATVEKAVSKVRIGIGKPITKETVQRYFSGNLESSQSTNLPLAASPAIRKAVLESGGDTKEYRKVLQRSKELYADQGGDPAAVSMSNVYTVLEGLRYRLGKGFTGEGLQKLMERGGPFTKSTELRKSRTAPAKVVSPQKNPPSRSAESKTQFDVVEVIRKAVAFVKECGTAEKAIQLVKLVEELRK